MLRSTLIAVCCCAYVFCKDVIIVGGGVSGVAAGNYLTNKGLNVTLLEARNRKGGRLWSDSATFGYTIDFGGAWIHGTENNSVYDLAKQSNVGLIEFSLDETAQYFSNCANGYSNSELDDLFHSTGDDFVDYMSKITEDFTDKQDKSIYTLLQDYLSTKKLTNVEVCLLKNYMVTEFENDYGSKIENLSAKSYDISSKSGSDILVKNGYWSLFDGLINFNYKLNSVVTSIDQTGTKPVVTLKDGSTISADYVLLTVPLGYLKQNLITFNPQLSTSKKSSIDKLGFGSLEKVVVEFDDVYWDKDNQIIKIISDPVDPLNYIINFYKAAGKNTLIFLIGGEDKYWKDYYTISNSDLKAKVVTALNKYYPRINTNSIKNIYATQWRNDPFAFGAYTSIATGSTLKDVDEFKITEGKLYFAGEHTNSDDLQTVVGAYNSGIRAAKQIIADSAVYLACSLLILVQILI